MNYCIATVAFWESIGLSTANLIKSTDGRAIVDKEDAEILAVKVDTNPNIAVLTKANALIELAKPEWKQANTRTLLKTIFDADYLVNEAHDVNKSYAKGNKVQSLGSVYRAIKDVPSGTAISNTTYWLKIVEKGTVSNSTNDSTPSASTLYSSNKVQSLLDFANSDIRTIKTDLAQGDSDLGYVVSKISNANVASDTRTETTEVAGGIVSLPKKVANGGGASVELKGMTLTNMVKNGNFANGTTGWSGSYGVTASTSNNELSFTAYEQWSYYGNTVEIISGRKYYACAKVKATTNLAILRLSHSSGAASYGTKAHTGSGNYEKLSFTCTANISKTALLDISDYRTTGFNVINMKEVMLLDLAALGLESLTTAELDALTESWFDGTKSRITGRVKSVGKNLFNPKSKIVYGKNIEDMINISGTTAWTNGYVDVKGLVAGTYTLSCSFTQKATVSKVSLDVRKYSASSPNYISAFSEVASGNLKAVFTLPQGESGIRLYLYSNLKPDTLTTSCDFLNILLEYSNVSTPIFETYKETLQYTPPTVLRRVPNGVQDVISNGSFIKRISEYVIQESDIAAMFTSNSELDMALTKTYMVSDNAGWGLGTLDKNTILDGFTEVSGMPNNASYVGTYAAESNRLVVAFAKGTTLAQAKTALVGKRLIYQLATPITYDNYTSGLLTSYPNGTVYSDPFIYDVGIYASSKMTIANTSYPIKSLNFIKKVDFKTGVETPLDTSTATIAGDGLSFTHASLTNGDIVAYEYETSTEYCRGYSKVSYLDSRYAIQDTAVTTDYYNWGVAVANGVASLTATKIV